MIAEIRRCPIPVIWLDSSLLVKRGQAKVGGKLGAPDRDRIEYLHENIYPLVRSGQLICPEANQSSELWRNRDAVSTVVNEYLLGVYASHPSIVQDRQTRRVMEAHARGLSTVGMPFSDLFSIDPLARLRENLSSDIFITLVETPSEELIDQYRRVRSSIHQEWEALRAQLVGAGVGHDQQLQVELRGEMRMHLASAQAYLDKMATENEPSLQEFSSYSRMLTLLAQWDGLTDGRKDIVGLRAFLESPAYHCVPYVYVSASLTAALLTDNRPIKSGDAKDVEHVALMLPYADLMIVDRYMKHLICKLGLDAKYGTIVCHLGDVEKFEEFFQRARSGRPLASLSA